LKPTLWFSRGEKMSRLTLIALSLILAFGSFGPTLMAKGGKGQGRGAEGAAGGKSNIHSNAQGTVDRDLGTDRAKEVGKGKKKGLKHHSKHHGKKKHQHHKEGDDQR
jgi:hypothetical protein